MPDAAATIARLVSHLDEQARNDLLIDLLIAQLEAQPPRSVKSLAAAKRAAAVREPRRKTARKAAAVRKRVIDEATKARYAAARNARRKAARTAAAKAAPPPAAKAGPAAQPEKKAAKAAAPAPAPAAEPSARAKAERRRGGSSWDRKTGATKPNGADEAWKTAAREAHAIPARPAD